MTLAFLALRAEAITGALGLNSADAQSLGSPRSSGLGAPGANGVETNIGAPNTYDCVNAGNRVTSGTMASDLVGCVGAMSQGKPLSGLPGTDDRVVAENRGTSGVEATDDVGCFKTLDVGPPGINDPLLVKIQTLTSGNKAVMAMQTSMAPTGS